MSKPNNITKTLNSRVTIIEEELQRNRTRRRRCKMLFRTGLFCGGVVFAAYATAVALPGFIMLLGDNPNSWYNQRINKKNNNSN